MIKLMSASILERIINKALTLDSCDHPFLENHKNKVLAVKLTDLNQELYFLIQQEKIQVYTTYSERPDTTLRGSLFLFLKQLRSDSVIGELIIDGDMELAHDLHLFTQDININWEEYFSFFMGDVITNRLGFMWKHVKETSENIKQRFTEDWVEYIQEEQCYIPTREEVEDFYTDIGELCHDVDRLQARLDRLSKTINS